MKKASLIAIVSITAAAFAAPAAAQMRAADGKGFYVGAALGQSDFKDGCSDVAAPGVSCDNKDTAWKFFGGYQFNRNFAAELGYTDLGKISASAPGVTAEIKASAWELDAVGLLPFASQFAGYGRLGLYYGKTEGTSNVIPSESDSNTGLTWGLGLQWDPMAKLGLRVEYQQYHDIGGDNTGKGNINVLSLGALWRF
jgi:OOP family OmpA-OmpF porin